MNLSDDKGAIVIGVFVTEMQYTFMLKFISYEDKMTEEYDYPMEMYFGTVYSAKVELGISFPEAQVWLSKKHPPNEVRIDHIKE